MQVTFVEGVKDEIAELTASPPEDAPSRRAEIEALKRRIAELFLDCQGNPYVGEMMGPGRHPELADCRRIRFDIEAYKGKPRFRLIYRNVPSDGAPAECRWLAVGPRAGLRTHRKAQQRSRAE
ncbi:MAG: hypothetical protein JJE35_10880 [Thermoleophilia bacterium]|nr:hypothetical protein [Thermoleophilia bacterium]